MAFTMLAVAVVFLGVSNIFMSCGFTALSKRVKKLEQKRMRR